MKVTFVSNYINHHQIPFSNEMFQALGENYRFIQTEPMEEERVRMGWGVDVSEIPYLRLYYEKKEECEQLILESDIVIFGGTEREEIIRPRLKSGKITVRNSERLYREGQWKAVSPRGLRRKFIDHTQYRNKKVYLLCCGAYVASDFHLVGAYPGKMLKWGYFPEALEYRPEQLINENAADVVQLLWAGRFLDLKHPEYAVLAAEHLRKSGQAFRLTMIGDGPKRQNIERLIAEKGLGEWIDMKGFMKPEFVRSHMERANIFLFTSNHLEGWGAVLNESMNSGCAVVANRAIGAVPFLIRDGENGLTYPNGNTSAFLEQVQLAAADAGLRKKLGRNAYDTIIGMWNPKSAAERLLKFLENLCAGKEYWEEEGPCSPAPILPPGFGIIRRLPD